MIMDFVVAIVDRARAEDMLEVYRSHGLPIVLTMLGNGTATSEHLSLYGLEATEKALVASVACGDMTRQLIKSAKRRLFIDIPGNGIMLAVPIKSVGGGRTLAFLTGNSAPDGAVPELSFEHELIMVIINEGHTDTVMDAARSAGAAGGTVPFAWSTVAKQAERFLGVSIAEEKELIIIVSKASEKAAIMKAIAENCGPGTPSGAISFSLPISAVAGLRVLEDD